MGFIVESQLQGASRWWTDLKFDTREEMQSWLKDAGLTRVASEVARDDEVVCLAFRITEE
jgi:hypothetical protein